MGCAHSGPAVKITASTARENLFMAPHPPQQEEHTQFTAFASGNFHLPLKNFVARAIESHHVIPSGRGRQAVRDLAVTAAELDGDRSIRTLFGGDAVERVGIIFVFLQVAFGVVNNDRPECVHRNLCRNAQSVDCFAVVPGRRDVEIEGILVRVASPGGGSADQMPYLVDLKSRAECPSQVRQVRIQRQQRIAHFLLADRIPVRRLEAPGTLLPDNDRILQRVRFFHVFRIGRVDRMRSAMKT